MDLKVGHQLVEAVDLHVQGADAQPMACRVGAQSLVLHPALRLGVCEAQHVPDALGQHRAGALADPQLLWPPCAVAHPV